MENCTEVIYTDNVSSLVVENNTNGSICGTINLDPVDRNLILILIIKGFLMILIILVAFFGNVLVILSIFFNRRLQVTTNYFLVSLAIADMLVASCAMTFNASVELRGEWLFGFVICDLYNSFDVYFSTVSILNLCCISMDRYYAILKPLQYPIYMTKRVVKWMLTLVWFAPTCISFLPIFMGWYATKDHLKYRIENPGVCSFEVNTVYAFVSSTMSFWLPCAIMLVLYYKVFQAARKQETAMLSRATSLTTLNNVHKSRRNSHRYFKNLFRRKTSQNAEHDGPSLSSELPMFSISLVSPQPKRHRTQSVYSSLSADTSVACCSTHDSPTCNCSTESAMSPSPTFLGVTDKEIYVVQCANHNSRSGSVTTPSETLSPLTEHLHSKYLNCHRTSGDSSISGSFCGMDRGQRMSYSVHSSTHAPTMRREHKAAKTLGIVMGAFIICWLPFFTWYLTVHICNEACNSPPELVASLFWIGYFNSTLNPFIYAYFRADFREAFKRTLKRLNFCCKKRPDL